MTNCNPTGISGVTSSGGGLNWITRASNHAQRISMTVPPTKVGQRAAAPEKWYKKTTNNHCSTDDCSGTNDQATCCVDAKCTCDHGTPKGDGCSDGSEHCSECRPGHGYNTNANLTCVPKDLCTGSSTSEKSAVNASAQATIVL